MKNARLSFAFVICLLVGTTALASPTAISDYLRKEITRLIQSPELIKNGIDVELVNVQFIINEKGYLEITQVETDNGYLKGWIIESINHKKINLKAIEYSLEAIYQISFLFRTEAS
ncbi:MAG TPA: hypothetical protein PKA00_03905 [Saprospiraceae bacterium]|nr:hypothetical protein [Saprospiraceae bacterium]HMQ82022.1 hypothetical protein [Saprospiraceae bacterium]